MKQLLTGKQMKQADTWSIKEFGMESLILMERAALCAAQHIMSVQKPHHPVHEDRCEQNSRYRECRS